MTKTNKDAKNKKPGIRRIRVLIWAIVFFLLLNVGVSLYFSQPELLLGNIDRGIGSLPYLFNQMDNNKKGTTVAWVGASVMQGYLNVSPDRTFPELVERLLRKEKKHQDLRSFNLAAAGHNFGDHYCVLEEAIRHNPDLIVVAIHFKSFSQHTSTSIPIQHKSMVRYLHDDPKKDELLSRFGIEIKDYYRFRLDGVARKISAFYRYHELMTEMATDSADPPTYVIQDLYKEAAGFHFAARKVARMHALEDRSIDYLWKLLPGQLITRNHEICSNLDFSDSNINWRTFQDLCELGKREEANILFYLTPINKAFVEEKHFFEWDVLRNYKHAVIEQIRGAGHLLFDATNRVDPAFFSDTDHMNTNGHAQLAKSMAKEVKRALKRGQYIKKGNRRRN